MPMSLQSKSQTWRYYKENYTGFKRLRMLFRKHLSFVNGDTKLSTWKVKAARLGIQRHPQLHWKFGANGLHSPVSVPVHLSTLSPQKEKGRWLKRMLILTTRSLSKYLRVVSGCSLWPGCFLIILEGFWECRFEGAYPYSRQSPQSSHAKHMGPILPVIRRLGQTCPGRQSPSPSPEYSPRSLHDCDLYRCAQAHQSAPEKRDSP